MMGLWTLSQKELEMNPYVITNVWQFKLYCDGHMQEMELNCGFSMQLVDCNNYVNSNIYELKHILYVLCTKCIN